MDDCIPPSLKLFDKNVFFSDKHSVSCSSIDHSYYRSSHDGTTLWSLYQVIGTNIRIGKGYIQDTCFSMENFDG